jgi:hypothetical protein
MRLLQTQGGRCPLCGDTLLYADREPNCPREWEQWLTGIRKAIARHNLAATPDPDKSRRRSYPSRALPLPTPQHHRRHQEERNL